ncbi:MAG: hypothetical protein IKU18_07225, partial [Bacteroidales bacterium]|nr:hypothetical protein [Bacteroidales bacterium]
IRVRFAYPEPGNVVVKALWITLFDSKAPKTAKKEKSRKRSKDEVGKSDSADSLAEEALDGTVDNQTVNRETGAGDNITADSVAQISQETPEEQEMAEGRKITTGQKIAEVQDAAPEQETAEQEKRKKPGGIHKLIEKYEKVKCKILSIYDKIKYILKNIKFYKELLQEEQTQALLRHLFLRLKKILWSIRPRKINADIVYGAAAPDTTGYCMAVYGILSPALGRSVRFTPDFEQAVFKGEFSLKGHITLFVIIMHACVFALDKKLRLLISKVKKFYKQENHQKENHKQEAKSKENGGQTAA